MPTHQRPFHNNQQCMAWKQRMAIEKKLMDSRPLRLETKGERSMPLPPPDTYTMLQSLRSLPASASLPPLPPRATPLPVDGYQPPKDRRPVYHDALSQLTLSAPTPPPETRPPRPAAGSYGLAYRQNVSGLYFGGRKLSNETKWKEALLLSHTPI